MSAAGFVRFVALAPWPRERAIRKSPETPTDEAAAGGRNVLGRRLPMRSWLHGSRRFVLLGLAAYCDAEARARPSMTTLARFGGITVSQVQRALADLQAAGYVEVEKHGNWGDHARWGSPKQTKRYRICTEEIAALYDVAGVPLPTASMRWVKATTPRTAADDPPRDDAQPAAPVCSEVGVASLKPKLAWDEGEQEQAQLQIAALSDKLRFKRQKTG